VVDEQRDQVAADETAGTGDQTDSPVFQLMFPIPRP